MDEQEFTEIVASIALEISQARAELAEQDVEIDDSKIQEICRRIAPQLDVETSRRESFEGLVVKLYDPKTRKFSLITPDDSYTPAEGIGNKLYRFQVEIRALQEVEVWAEDILEAHDRAFADLEEMALGEYDEVSAKFLDADDPHGDFGPGFSLN